MSSRMERYSDVIDRNYSSQVKYKNRSDKNRTLYEDIQNLRSYTNIEGVASIEKTNEIDISKVKNMLQNRENYKKQKQFGRVLSKEKMVEELVEEEYVEPKNYDIKDILSKIKKEELPRDNHKLTAEQYEFLKNLKIKNVEESEDTEQDSNDVGLLDELKSDTMVGDAASIKKILESQKDTKIEDTKEEIDRSFYTSSFGFTQSDFEELKSMNYTLKKSNKAIILLLSFLILIVIIVIVYFLLK